MNTDLKIEEQLNDNIDRPERHNINPMNRPPRNEDPLSPRNTAKPSKASKPFYQKVADVLNDVEDMLISKNKKYGNSALAPIRIFSEADSVEQIKVRIDDKLSRIKESSNSEDEDVLMDLIGYLVLLKIANEK